jgi:hypothetical protein
VPEARSFFPAAFFSRFQSADAAILGDKRDGFSMSLIKGAAHRCRWGFPQVVLCGALQRMKPFPTSFWLVCPFLIRSIATLESGGGVAGLKEESRNMDAEWRKYHLSHALLRLSMIKPAQRAFLRNRRKALYRAICARGVGGARYSEDPVAVKCLHLQMASFIALRRHPMSEWLCGKVVERECNGAFCRAVN